MTTIRQDKRQSSSLLFIDKMGLRMQSGHVMFIPFIFCHSFGVRWRGQLPKEGSRLSSPQALHPALPGGSWGVPRPAERHSPSSVSCVFLRAHSQRCPEDITREASEGHPGQVSEPPHLALLNSEEQRLYSKLLLDDGASQPISEREPSQPTQEAHFSRWYTQSCSFGQCSKLVIRGEARNTDGLVDWYLHHNKSLQSPHYCRCCTFYVNKIKKTSAGSKFVRVIPSDRAVGCYLQIWHLLLNITEAESKNWQKV